MDNNFDMSSLDELLASTDLSNVTSEGAGFEDLPNGYYLCSVDSTTLGPNKKGAPMVTLKLKVIQNGIVEVTDEDGNVYLDRKKGTANRMIFKYYVLTEERKVKDLISDLLKFEGETEGEALLGEVLTYVDEDGNKKNVRLTTELLTGCLEIINGTTIYVKSETTDSKTNPGEKSTWNNLLSWKRAGQLGLLDVVEE